MASISVFWPLLTPCGVGDSFLHSLGNPHCFGLPHTNPIPVIWEAETTPPAMIFSNSKVIPKTLQINGERPVKFEFQLKNEKCFSMSQILLGNYIFIFNRISFIFFSVNVAILFNRLTILSVFLSLKPRLPFPRFL